MDLTTKAMIASLSIKGIWSAVAEDEAVSKEVALKHNVDPKVGRYVKNLLDPKQVPTLKAFNSSRSALRNVHRTMTLAWNDRGGRMLPQQQYFDYMTKIGESKQRLIEAYEAFLLDLPALTAKAQAELNGLFRAEDWPDPAVLRDKVVIRVRIEPLADAADFRVQLGQDEEAKIKAQAEKDMAGRLAVGLAEMIGDLKACVVDSKERLEAYTTGQDGKVVKTFRDSAITNVRRMVENARKLNVTGDKTITSLIEEIDQIICQKDPQVLRDNFVVRQQVVSGANEIARKLASIEDVLFQQAEEAA